MLFQPLQEVYAFMTQTPQTPSVYPGRPNATHRDFISVWHETKSKLENVQLPARDRIAAWRSMEGLAGSRSKTEKAEVEKSLYAFLRSPLPPQAPAAERSLRRRFIAWLQAHADASVHLYFPELSEVWVRDEKGEFRPGTLDVAAGNALWGGTSLYDFHVQYPVNGTGVRKDRIWVKHEDRRVDIVTYCREQKHRVFCNRCLSDITELSEPFSCMTQHSDADKVRQVLHKDFARQQKPIPEDEDIPEGGILLRLHDPDVCVLLLWRWRIVLRPDKESADEWASLKQDALACAERYGAGELWLLGRSEYNTIFQLGYRQEHSGWHDVVGESESALGWATFHAGHQERLWREHKAKEAARQALAHKRKQLVKEAKAARLAGPPPLGEQTWSISRARTALRVQVQEQKSGRSRLVVTLQDETKLCREQLEVWMPGMRKAEQVWHAGVLNAGGRTYFSRMATGWARTWRFLRDHEVDLRAHWVAGEKEAQKYAAAFALQEADAARAREELLRAQEAGRLSAAELANRLRGARTERRLPPRVQRLLDLQGFIRSTWAEEVEAWLLARFLDVGGWGV